MTDICLVCGDKMEHIQERIWECSKCGANAWMGDYGSLCFDAELFDEEDFFCLDEIPIGCTVCGGDYPNCKTSCPLFDD